MSNRVLFGLIGAISVAGCTLLLSSELEGNGVNGSNTTAQETGGSSGGADGSSGNGGDGNINPSNDANTDGGNLGNPPCPAFAYFCDDFESGNLSKWTEVETNGGEVSIDTSLLAHTGTHSARAVSNINQAVDGSVPTDRAELQTNLNAAKKSGLMAIRVYVYMKKQFTSDTTILKYTAPGDDDMNVKVDGTEGLFLVDTDTLPSADQEILGTMGPPLNKWFCLEWRVTVGTQGHQTLLVDGKIVVDADENTMTPSGFTSISVGFPAANGKFDQEIYYDDVALADQAIGCF